MLPFLQSPPHSHPQTHLFSTHCSDFSPFCIHFYVFQNVLQVEYHTAQIIFCKPLYYLMRFLRFISVGCTAPISFKNLINCFFPLHWVFGATTVWLSSGCVLLRGSFSLWCAGSSLRWLLCCGAVALECRFSNCGARAGCPASEIFPDQAAELCVPALAVDS